MFTSTSSRKTLKVSLLPKRPLINTKRSYIYNEAEVFSLSIASLSTGVFETQTATGREHFAC